MGENPGGAGFYGRAMDYFLALAKRRSFGTAVGQWKHPRFGVMHAFIVSGWIGRLYVSVVLCETYARLSLGQGRIWWYMNDWAAPFELKDIERRRPMAETHVNDEDDLEDVVESRLRWLEERRSIEDVLSGIYAKSISGAAFGDSVRDDPDNEPPAEDPEG